MPVWRVTCTCLVTGQTCQNVFHIASDDDTVTDAQVAGSISGRWLQLIKPFQHNGAKWTNIEVRKVTGALNAPFNLTVNITGTGAGQTSADDTVRCRVLKFQTARAGRRGRGRLYVPGTSLQAWENGTLNAASIAAGDNLIAQLTQAYCPPTADENIQLVICSRQNPADFATVLQIVQRPIAGFQRRRNIGVGV